MRIKYGKCKLVRARASDGHTRGTMSQKHLPDNFKIDNVGFCKYWGAFGKEYCVKCLGGRHNLPSIKRVLDGLYTFYSFKIGGMSGAMANEALKPIKDVF